jgi:LacI family transcriptional regulator
MSRVLSELLQRAMRSLHRAGLHVPDDISVVGFDDIDLSQSTQPPLTTVRLSRSELGQKAFEALYRNLQTHVREGEEINVSASLLLTQSTAPVRIAPRQGLV